MMRIAGSDAITELYGDKGAVAQEIIDAKRAELGLDQPFLTQYLAWGWRDTDRRHGHQLHFRTRRVSDLCVQAPGDASADGSGNLCNSYHLYSAGRFGGGAA